MRWWQDPSRLAATALKLASARMAAVGGVMGIAGDVTFHDYTRGDYGAAFAHTLIWVFMAVAFLGPFFLSIRAEELVRRDARRALDEVSRTLDDLGN